MLDPEETEPSSSLTRDESDDKPTQVMPFESDETQQKLAHMDLHDPESFREEMERLQEERDAFEEQYNTLLSKVSHMRTTLGERLQQDAEELDRREQQIERLTLQVGELEAQSATLQSELVLAHEESKSLTMDIEKLRSAQANAKDESLEIHRLESKCRDLQQTLDTQRVDIERWENACMEERSLKNELQQRLQRAEDTLHDAEERNAELNRIFMQEKQAARQMQQALEELQESQDRDLQRSLGDLQHQLDSAESELEKYKLHVHDMDAKMEEATEAKGKCDKLEHEVKEKNLLIGKLRHEAVILNEHLTSALTRLRKTSSEDQVDRRLMTNLMLQFLTAPRADTKRFEILRLIASVLQWDDAEREKAGLQRQSDRSLGYGFLGLGGLVSSPRKSMQASTSNANDESVSNLFVEFLLSEVERGKEKPGDEAGSSSTPAADGGKAFDLHSLEQLDRAERDAPSDLS